MAWRFWISLDEHDETYRWIKDETMGTEQGSRIKEAATEHAVQNTYSRVWSNFLGAPCGSHLLSGWCTTATAGSSWFSWERFCFALSCFHQNQMLASTSQLTSRSYVLRRSSAYYWEGFQLRIKFWLRNGLESVVVCLCVPIFPGQNLFSQSQKLLSNS